MSDKNKGVVIKDISVYKQRLINSVNYIQHNIKYLADNMQTPIGTDWSKDDLVDSLEAYDSDFDDIIGKLMVLKLQNRRVFQHYIDAIKD